MKGSSRWGIPISSKKQTYTGTYRYLNFPFYAYGQNIIKKNIYELVTFGIQGGRDKSGRSLRP
jgi:hypothetical protein